VSDLGPPPPPPPQHSVVVDEHATVRVRTWPKWVAGLAVVGFVAFTVVYFVVKDEGAYTPGPMAAKFLDVRDSSNLDVEISDHALRCMDDKADGLDPEVVFADGSVNPLAVEPEPAAVEFMGAMFDECLSSQERVDLLSASLVDETPVDALTTDQAHCLASAWDGIFVDNGGYGQFFADPESASALYDDVFAAFDACQVDVNALGG
jgi:hypothetical protein